MKKGFIECKARFLYPNDEDEELQDALEVSRCEAKFQRRAGERYEHGGGSGGGGGGGGVRGFFRRATS
jgi:hypothetical protein